MKPNLLESTETHNKITQHSHCGRKGERRAGHREESRQNQLPKSPTPNTKTLNKKGSKSGKLRIMKKQKRNKLCQPLYPISPLLFIKETALLYTDR